MSHLDVDGLGGKWVWGIHCRKKYKDERHMRRRDLQQGYLLAVWKRGSGMDMLDDNAAIVGK